MDSLAGMRQQSFFFVGYGKLSAFVIFRILIDPLKDHSNRLPFNTPNDAVECPSQWQSQPPLLHSFWVLGNASLLPLTFTQLSDPDPYPELPLPPIYSASAAPSLSKLLNSTRVLDFFRSMAWDRKEKAAATVALMILIDDEEVVKPVVCVGGPCEYIAAAEKEEVERALG